jgi:2-dehydro-3-deoxyphosphogluconate aldolase / (4S)-4-hydroxy-2-oxoglutarate aldolase
MQPILTQIGDIGIIPVVVIDNAADAVPLCRALLDGGLPIAEVTFRTAAAEDAIRAIAQELPNVLVGAGTVLSPDQAARARAAGAQFIVSPGFNPRVVEYCQQEGLPVTPGCSNPSDIGLAVEKDLEVVKFFPAEAMGGIKTLKAIAAPFGKMRFIPTGGIEAANLNEYLSFNKVVACGGSWMVKADFIKAGRFDDISRLTREAVATMLDFRIVQVAMPQLWGQEQATPSALATALSDASNTFKVSECDPQATVLTVSTRSMPRAIAYFKRCGIDVDMATAVTAVNGDITSIRLLDAFWSGTVSWSGAIQLIQCS